LRRLARLGVALAIPALALGVHDVAAYTPENHERSVREAADLCRDERAISFSAAELDPIIHGVREPDEPSLFLAEIAAQRIEPGARGKKRGINAIRVAEQSFHGSPNPTRAPYTTSPEDQALQRQAVATPAQQLLPDRFELDVHSYDTNQAMRNKLLINASQLLCVSLAHRDPRTSARKLGNLIHMVGDTYSASHVQRSAPEGSPGSCGTEKIEWHFSMDLVVWKEHAPADEEHGDWRFACLVEHAAELMRMWRLSRETVDATRDTASKLARSNEAINQASSYLCENVLREDPEVLARPAGGAAASYSIASGTDNWERVFTFWRPQPEDQPIQPVGLTGPDEARDFVAGVNQELESWGRPPWFSYPARSDPDLCQRIRRREALPEALRCTPEEIGWAMEGSSQVDLLVIPPRGGRAAASQ
jgi:hypothetical protein